MGGTLHKLQRSHDDSTGRTIIKNKLPTLVMHAERDGLVRITRGAESYFHQVQNIQDSQDGQYPVHVMKGLNHASFMDPMYNISRVVELDLFRDVDTDQGYSLVVERMIAYISEKEGLGDGAEKMKTFNDEAKEYFQKFIKLMELEGSYQLGKPCYNNDIINPDTPKVCLKGSNWITQMQQIMGGMSDSMNVKLVTEDNFHRVFTEHYPELSI